MRRTLWVLLRGGRGPVRRRCVNLANLLLARAANRRQEFAIRASLGASPSRLARQCLAEAIPLAVLGAALGIATAHGLLRVLIPLLPASMPRVEEIGLHGPVLLAAVLLSVATAFAIALAPAARARADVARGPRARGRGPDVLLVTEIACTVVLLVGAGLLMKSFEQLRFLLCALASLTYCVNDIADLSADRKHWSKKNRPFASGALPVRDGLIAVGIGVPLLILAGLLISPRVGACLLAYLMITLAYSFGLKRIPLLDTLIIGILFTVRILLGIAASGLVPSAWLLTFSMFFFFSLAVAKRHTELLRAGERTQRTDRGPRLPCRGPGRHPRLRHRGLDGLGPDRRDLSGRRGLPPRLYTQPQWLWVAPVAIFLFIGRVWLLSHRGLMTDDPVAFAVRDKVSLGLGALVGAALLLAI